MSNRGQKRYEKAQRRSQRKKQSDGPTPEQQRQLYLDLIGAIIWLRGGVITVPRETVDRFQESGQHVTLKPSKNNLTLALADAPQSADD